VDDDPGMTETLADILSDIGYDVAAAGDGFRAIEMIKEKAYDVALMDIKMPRINGLETFKEVKHISPSTMVIMMTAYALEDLVQEVLAEGTLGIFYKPLEIDKIVDFIEEARTRMSAQPSRTSWIKRATR
jgi:two-component system response regulator HydG